MGFKLKIVFRKDNTITAEDLKDPKKRLEHCVNLYLGVVPDTLRSSYEQEELGHEQVNSNALKKIFLSTLLI